MGKERAKKKSNGECGLPLQVLIACDGNQLDDTVPVSSCREKVGKILPALPARNPVDMTKGLGQMLNI